MPVFPLVARSAGADRTIVTLGHGLGVVLVDLDGRGAQVLSLRELDARGLDPFAAFLGARDRLVQIVRTGRVRHHVLAAGHGVRGVMIRHAVLAASCLVLPGLFGLVTRALALEGDPELRVVAPSRDRLFVFEMSTPGAREAMRAFLDRRCPRPGELSRELFTLDPIGIVPSRPTFSATRSVDDETTALDVDLEELTTTAVGVHRHEGRHDDRKDDSAFAGIG